MCGTKDKPARQNVDPPVDTHARTPINTNTGMVHTSNNKKQGKIHCSETCSHFEVRAYLVPQFVTNNTPQQNLDPEVKTYNTV